VSGWQGSVSVRYENRGEKYSPIINSVKQTLQTTQAIITTTQQTKFLIRVEFLSCYNTTPPTRDLVPRSWTIRGRGGEKKESRRSSTPPTRDSAPCRRRTFVEKTFRREMATSKNETIGKSRGRTIAQSDDQGKHSHSNREDTRQEE
jgi:hypothetical protein